MFSCIMLVAVSVILDPSSAWDQVSYSVDPFLYRVNTQKQLLLNWLNFPLLFFCLN